MRGPWHPSESIAGSVARYLQGRCIILGITGSVAAYRALDTARWLLRRGARVVFAATRPALELLGEKLLHWATGVPPITGLSGEVEHIQAAYGCDAMLVAPATLTTMTKIAYGIGDNPVSLTAISMIGSGRPVAVAPAMHENMMRTPQYRRVISLLEESGVVVVPPVVEEGVGKYPRPDLLARIAAALASRGRDLEGLRIVVTAGPTREWIDPVRFISNPSSGRMGVEIAAAAWARGARVVLVHGWLSVEPPHMVERVMAGTAREMREALERVLEEPADAVVASAAPADFAPAERRSEKIRSGSSMTLRLEATPKIVEAASGRARVLVVFAAETVRDRDSLVKAALEKMERYGAQAVVGNRVGVPWAGFASEDLDAVLIWRRGERLIIEDLDKINKEILAHRILDTVRDLLG